MRRCAATALSVLVLACGGQAFNPAFEERADPVFSEALRAIEAAPAREERPVVVAIADNPRRLMAYDLREERMLFTVEVEVEAAIAAGGYVVSSEGSAIVVRSLEDGQEAFRITGREQRLVGADEADGHLVVSVSRGDGPSPSGAIYGAIDGRLTWNEELPLPVGVPAVAGSLVVVPWATQRLSMLDAETGREIARHRMEDSVIGHAFSHDGAVYVGQHGVFRITESLASGLRARAAYYEPAGRPLPGQPPLLRDGYEPLLAADSARHRLRLVWAPAGEGETIRLTDDSLYFVFYRLIFALEADEDAMRWAQLYDGDLVGAAAGSGGILIVGDDGALSWLSASNGEARWTGSLGTRIRVADVRLGSFQPPAAEAAEGAPGEPDVRGQLTDVASCGDPRLGGGRALAVRYLANFDDEAVTAALIQLCSNRADTGPARRAACEAVAERTTGGTHVRDALTLRSSFLEDTPAPPVGALARAAAGMQLRVTVPHLVRHLEDPATPEEELVGVIEALGQLGDARAVNPIETYLRLYHADSSDPVQARTLGAAAQALMRLDEPRALRMLNQLIDDPLCPDGVRERLQAALVADDEAQSARGEATEGGETAAGGETAETAAPVDERPDRITNDIRVEVFAPAERELRRCLASGEGVPQASARLAVVVGSDGAVRAVHVAPQDLGACMEPIVRALHFPVTRRGGEAIIHMIRR